MAHHVLNSVQETTLGTGTGALVLAGPVSKMLGLVASGVADGDTFLARIEHATAAEMEIAVCTYHSSGNSITRGTPLKSSNGGAAIDFSAGVKTISVVATAVPVHPLRLVTSGITTVMTIADYELGLKKTVSAAHAVTLPAILFIGQRHRVSDCKGDLDVGSNEITVSPASGTINGAANIVMRAAWMSLEFVAVSATEWVAHS